jgi:hypothetical protein
MKNKLAVLGLALILSALIVSGCGGYAETEIKTGRPSTPFACTSFAVYSDETFYGMNFDYPDTEIRFTIRRSGDRKVFQMEFAQGNGWAATVGMNSAGLFSSCQMVYPEAPAATSPGADDLYPWQVYDEALFNFDSVADVTEFISDRKVIHDSVTLHDLFADTRGDAMVVEVGDEENVVTRIENDFIVMTNFPNGDFAGQSYENVEGAGAERYRIAYENISDHVAAFDVERGFETLEKAVMSGETASTLSSMVFDPERGEIYIALRRDFSRVWKVSIADGTIETFSGFGKARKTDLDAAGVLASDLEKASRGMPWGYIIIGLVVVLVGGECFFVIRKRAWALPQRIPARLWIGGILVVGAIVLGVYSIAARRQEAGGELAFQPDECESSAIHVTDASIAYVADQSPEDRFSAIYVMDADSSRQQCLVGSKNGFDMFPSWSPDRQKIAYLVHTPGEDEEFWNGNDIFEVWVAPLDGSAHIRISDAIPSINEVHPVTWSPDGDRLAFLAQVEDDTTDTLFVIRADGNEVQYRIPLDFWAIEMMVWSPTGEELLFIPETSNSRMTLHMLSLEDQQVTPIQEVKMLDSWEWGVPMDWSPNGTEFAIANPLDKEVLIMSTDGELRQAFQVPSGYPVEVAWSPNGAYIAVSASARLLDAGDASDMEIHILDAETGEPAAAFHLEEKMMTLLNWSSDSSRLLLTTLFDTPEGWSSADGLWIYDVTSGALEQLDTGGEDDQVDEMGVWSP